MVFFHFRHTFTILRTLFLAKLFFLNQRYVLLPLNFKFFTNWKSNEVAYVSHKPQWLSVNANYEGFVLKSTLFTKIYLRDKGSDSLCLRLAAGAGAAAAAAADELSILFMPKRSQNPSLLGGAPHCDVTKLKFSSVVLDEQHFLSIYITLHKNLSALRVLDWNRK